MPGEELVADRRAQAAAAKKKYDETGEATVVTQYSEMGMGCTRPSQGDLSGPAL